MARRNMRKEGGRRWSQRSGEDEAVPSDGEGGSSSMGGRRRRRGGEAAAREGRPLGLAGEEEEVRDWREEDEWEEERGTIGAGCERFRRLGFGRVWAVVLYHCSMASSSNQRPRSPLRPIQRPETAKRCGGSQGSP
jgi:hypothetical protein